MITVSIHSVSIRRITNRSLFKIGLACNAHAVHFAYLPNERALMAMTKPQRIRNGVPHPTPRRPYPPDFWQSDTWQAMADKLCTDMDRKFHKRIRQALVTLALLTEG